MHRRDLMHPLPWEKELQTPRAQRDSSSFFPQAVANPGAGARSSYLSCCYFWLPSHCGLRGAPGAAGGVMARKHLRALCSGSRQRPAAPVCTGLPHALSPAGAPGAGSQRDPRLTCSALRVSWRSPSSWEPAWFWGSPVATSKEFNSD